MTDALPSSALVLGFRRTGQAVARALAARGVRVRAGDGRDAAGCGVDPAAWAGCELRLGTGEAGLLDGVGLVVPSPGVPCDAPLLVDAVRRGIPVWSEIELAFRLLACPVVAITGTNGKSTTTTVVGRALELAGRRTFTGGNLGTPLVDAVAGAPEVAVAEVSSFQLEWVDRFRPTVGALLNVTDDHLDRHGTFAAYRDAKARLFARQEPGDHAVLNHEDPAVREVARGVRARVTWFGWTPEADVHPDGDRIVLRLPGAAPERLSLARTRLTGRHNVENLCAAAAVARLAGAPLAAVQEAVDTVAPLAHRLALVATRGGVRWFDDSKATNVGATVKSLASFTDPVVLLAGGVDKGGDYGPLVTAARGRVRRVCCYGAARDVIATALRAGGIDVACTTTLDEAVAVAAASARPGDVVLLAPACSSFDQFTDYAARGRAFRAAVEALP